MKTNYILITVTKYVKKNVDTCDVFTHDTVINSKSPEFFVSEEG